MEFEALLLAAGIALGLAPLLTRVRRRGPRVVAISSALAVSALCSWAAVSARVVRVDEKDVKSRPIKVEDAGFTSSEACQSCHPDQYATWQRAITGR